MNNNIVYLVSVQSGGLIRKPFNNELEAKEYYSDNIKFNSIISKLYPITCNGRLYYYSIGSCFGILYSNLDYAFKVKELDINNFNENDLIKLVEERLNNERDDMPPF